MERPCTGRPWWFGTNSLFRTYVTTIPALNREFVLNHHGHLVFLKGPFCPDRRVHVFEAAFGVVNVGGVAERVQAEGLEVAAAEGRCRDARRVGGVLAVGQAVLL